MLHYKRFTLPSDLTKWVNENDVKVVSITQSTEQYTLFFEY